MMDEYGRLHRTDGGEDVFSHVPDWYRWEREQVRKQVRDGLYIFEDTVRVEELVNCKDAGFIPLGEVRFTHDMNGFTLHGTLDDGTTFDFNRSVISMYSCHIEYNFKGRGDAIDLATKGKTYFIFPLTARNVLTKIHFAEEEMPRIFKAMYKDEILSFGTNFGKNYHQLILKRKELMMKNGGQIKINGQVINQIPEIGIIEVGV